MKMKKLLVISILLAAALVGYGQATPGKIVRIANRTAAFGVNLPAGTQIYCVEDSTNWNVKAAGVASTRTINTAWAAAEIEWIRTTLQVNYNADSVNLEVDTLKASYHQVVIKAATTDHAGAMTAADKTKLDALVTTSGTAVAQIYEVAADTLTACKVFLPSLAVDSTKFVVSVNGVELSHAATTGQYWVAPLASRYVRFKMPIYKYDVISVQYFK